MKSHYLRRVLAPSQVVVWDFWLPSTYNSPKTWILRLATMRMVPKSSKNMLPNGGEDEMVMNPMVESEKSPTKQIQGKKTLLRAYENPLVSLN